MEVKAVVIVPVLAATSMVEGEVELVGLLVASLGECILFVCLKLSLTCSLARTTRVQLWLLFNRWLFGWIHGYSTTIAISAPRQWRLPTKQRGIQSIRIFESAPTTTTTTPSRTASTIPAARPIWRPATREQSKHALLRRRYPARLRTAGIRQTTRIWRRAASKPVRRRAAA